MLGKEQLNQSMVKEAIASFIKAADASEYMAVISASDAAGCHAELATYLVMCRKKVKEAHVDTSLIYAYAKSEQLAQLEEFISAPNVGRIQDVAERCFSETMYEAAKLLFNSISNFARLATCLMPRRAPGRRRRRAQSQLDAHVERGERGVRRAQGVPPRADLRAAHRRRRRA